MRVGEIVVPVACCDEQVHTASGQLMNKGSGLTGELQSMTAITPVTGPHTQVDCTTEADT